MDYELIEYINDVNREYTEVLVEQNINGVLDTAYVYGAGRLSLDRFDGTSGYYLYDPRGSVTGITNEEGQIYQSYRYSVAGGITFGAPQYENEYTYNGESYNPNIKSQYLRARYYCVVTAAFITEDSYLGDISEPLTLNRYNYCLSCYLNYADPSGFMTDQQIRDSFVKEFDWAGIEIGWNYLYGKGKDYVIDGNGYAGPQSLTYKWGLYMKDNPILTGKVGDVVIPIGQNLRYNESIEIDMTFQMIIENGEGAIGYQFMHGTNAEAGDFQIQGTIRNQRGNIIYDLLYTWNDKMDPFPEIYDSDNDKAEFAKKFPFANPQDYFFHVTWHDKTIIYDQETWYRKNNGWLADWNSDWYWSLSRDYQDKYDFIDSEQILTFYALPWKDYLERIKEKYSSYYECRVDDGRIKRMSPKFLERLKNGK